MVLGLKKSFGGVTPSSTTHFLHPKQHLSLWTLILPTRASSCPGTAGG